MKPRNKIEPWLFVIPALVIYLGIVVLPVAWSIVYSTFNWNGITSMKFVGLGNFERMFNDRVFHITIKNSLIFMSGTVIYQMIIGLALAILVTSVPRGSVFFRIVFYTPCIVSSVAMCKIFEKLLSVYPQGIFAAIMKMLGLPQIALLSDPNTALYTTIFIDGYMYVGIYMVIFYNALTNISQDVIEAAYLDGCGWSKQLFYIKLPLIVPIMFSSLVLLVNGALKAFGVSYILTGGGPGYATELVATYMYKTAFEASNFGYASALGLFLLVESMIAVTTLRAISRRIDIYS